MGLWYPNWYPKNSGYVTGTDAISVLRNGTAYGRGRADRADSEAPFLSDNLKETRHALAIDPDIRARPGRGGLRR